MISRERAADDSKPAGPLQDKMCAVGGTADAGAAPTMRPVRGSMRRPSGRSGEIVKAKVGSGASSSGRSSATVAPAANCSLMEHWVTSIRDLTTCPIVLLAAAEMSLGIEVHGETNDAMKTPGGTMKNIWIGVGAIT